ncbi:MAG: site-2 protease family protein [Gemmatimonadaceae bacterium]
MSELHVAQYFARSRRLTFPGRFLVEGLVLPEHRGPSPELSSAIMDWKGRHYWADSADGRVLVLVHELESTRERWWLHALLLAITFVTMSVAGAMLAGVAVDNRRWPTLAVIGAGLPFALSLISILLAHELGHYAAARWYLVNASPPFFIPFPPVANVLGTMGAFIHLRSPLFDRRTLFDIGVAGPLAGLAVAIPLLTVGLARSHIVPGAPPLALSHQLVHVDGDVIYLGDSLLLAGVRALVAPRGVLLLHPLAIAGWAGVLVTMLNMLPMAQLDGSHVTYALFGDAQKAIAVCFWLALAGGAVLTLDPGWGLWAVAALVIGRGSLAHPAIAIPERPLDVRRRAVARLTLLLGALCVIPMPLTIGG